MAQLFEGFTDGRFAVLVIVVSLFSLFVQSMWRRYFPFNAPPPPSDLAHRVETLEQAHLDLRDSYNQLVEGHERLARVVNNLDPRQVRIPASATPPEYFTAFDQQLALMKDAITKLAEEHQTKGKSETVDSRPNQWERVSQDDDT